MDNEHRAVPAEVTDAAGDDIRGLMRTTRERVTEVLLATERAATDVVEAANAEAERIVREAHASVQELTDERMAKLEAVAESVAEKAATLDAELGGLRALIDRSIAELGAELGGAVETPPADPEDEFRDRDRSEAVRVLAAQLIAAGHTPEEAGDRLVKEFGVGDPTHALAATGYKSRRFRRNRTYGSVPTEP